MNLVILYPKEFNCFSKFARKVDNVICNKHIESVVFPKDNNNFIRNFFNDLLPISKVIQNEKWSEHDITHAIIFDDGEEFPRETSLCKDKGIALRRLKINITRVVNIKTDKKFNGRHSAPNYEYIGRGSYWGNPYSMHENGDTREEVIRKFKYDFDYDKFINKEKSKVFELAGKRLGCFCKPSACHGDVLADYLNSWDDGT
ncbi:MAG: DUF4326 domain-containing protein [Kangiellaceae bacterium]|nr:DUF4326 domain-containing protein [Kangiellaceae bacterium]MCW8998847.1 DUF4326 domain-containing protein [Kangiellaceae bacterium]